MNIFNSGPIVAGGNALFVDYLSGSNATALRGRADRPYQTLSGAQSGALSGDCIIVMPGVYTDKNLGKADVNWFFYPGAKVNISGVVTSGDAVFNDLAVAKNFRVDGHGDFSIVNTGANTVFSILYSNAIGTNISLECNSLNAGITTGGGINGNLAICDGGNQTIVSKFNTSNGSSFITNTNPSTAQRITVKTAYSQTSCVFQNNFGSQWCKADSVSGAQACIQGAPGAALQIFDIGDITFSDQAIKGGGGKQYGTFRVISGFTAAGIGVDISNTGFQVIDGGEIVTSGVGVSCRNAGSGVFRIGKVTAPIAILGNNGFLTLEGGEYIGNNQSGSLLFNNTSNSQKITLQNVRLVNLHSTGSAVYMNDSTATTILQGGCALITQTGSSYSVNSLPTGTLKCYGHSVGTKAINSGNLNFLVGIFEADPDVT